MSAEPERRTYDFPYWAFSDELKSFPPLPEAALLCESFDEWIKVYDDVEFLTYLNEPERAARRLDLPPNTDWHDIFQYVNEQRRRHFARECGVSEDTPWDEIKGHDSHKFNEVYDRELFTREHKVFEFQDHFSLQMYQSDEFREQVNTELAAAMGAEYESHYDWKSVLDHYLLLGMSDYSPESIAKRLQEVRSFILDKIAQGEGDTPFGA